MQFVLCCNVNRIGFLRRFVCSEMDALVVHANRRRPARAIDANTFVSSLVVRPVANVLAVYRWTCDPQVLVPFYVLTYDLEKVRYLNNQLGLLKI